MTATTLIAVMFASLVIHLVQPAPPQQINVQHVKQHLILMFSMVPHLLAFLSQPVMLVNLLKSLIQSKGAKHALQTAMCVAQQMSALPALLVTNQMDKMHA